MNATQHDSLPGFSALLRAALRDLDPGANTFLEMLSDDAIMEFPFAPSDMTQKLVGRAAITRYVGDLAEVLSIESVSAPVIYRSSESGVTVLEFTSVGRGIQSGKSYHQTYISVITVQGGRIVHYRDYWNPLVVLETMRPEAGVAGGAS